MDDGTLLPADLIILATGAISIFFSAPRSLFLAIVTKCWLDFLGFGSMRDAGRPIFGDKVIDSTGPVWGLDSNLELQGVGRYSGHPG